MTLPETGLLSKKSLHVSVADCILCEVKGSKVSGGNGAVQMGQNKFIFHFSDNRNHTYVGFIVILLL